MKKLIVLAVAAAGMIYGQQSFPALRTQGQSVEPNAAGTNGGYLVFRPVNNNPYNGAPCTDVWSNPVQQPVPTATSQAFGANDLVLWNSLSPSMPFTSGGYGLVQPMTFNTPGASGPCGSPLPVNTNYGLNTNGYYFARAGLATDNPLYNSIQSLQGGVLAGSFTAGIWYPAGTTICTAYNGSSCTSTAVIASGVCPGGAVGCYLGGHVDVGHSVGPPASGGIGSVTNPYTAAEGAVAGQTYFDDGNGVYPTYLPCLRVYSGTSFGCAGDVAEVYNSFADMASSPSTTAAFQTHSGTFIIWGSGDSQFQTVKATSTFNSLATGTTAAFQQSTGAFRVNGDGKAFFQLLCANGNPVSEACTYGLTAAGALTVASAASVVFNSSATGTTSAVQQVSGNFQINGDGKSFFQSVCTNGNPVTEACSYGLTAAGVLTVASCTGCGGYSAGTGINITLGTIYNTGVTSISSTGNGLSFSASTGSISAALAQNIQTSAGPTWNTVTASTFFNCGATGTSPCIKQASGTWSVNGQGDYAGQSISLGANNGTSATAGAGAVINKTGSAVSIQTYDSGGSCGIGTGEASPGIACSSDQRLKTPGLSIASGLDEIRRLRPVTFHWLRNGLPGIGFIAQEVQTVLPALVRAGADGYLTLSEDGIIPYLVRAIQEQQVEIETLRRNHK